MSSISSKNGVAGIVAEGSSTVNVGGDVWVSYVSGSGPARSTKRVKLPFPAGVESFAGRDEELTSLNQLLFQERHNKVAITGLPGSGKTELAKHFARKCYSENKVENILWINAATEDTLKKDFVIIAGLLGKPCSIKDDILEIRAHVYDILKENKCLFVFDNVQDRTCIRNHEPDDDFYLVVTCVHRNLGFHDLPLGYLDSSKSLSIIQKILGRFYKTKDEDVYRKLAQNYALSPLGLNIIFGPIFDLSISPDFNLTEYMATLNKKIVYDQKINDKDMAVAYTNSIGSALETSIQSLKNYIQDNNIEKVVYICSFLDFDNIKRDDLVEISKIQRNFIEHLLVKMTKFFLLTVDYTKKSYIMHGLVGDRLRHIVQKKNKQNETYGPCLEFLLQDLENPVNCLNTIWKYNIILNYADEFTETFISVFEQHKTKIYKNRNVQLVLLYMLDKWNCEKTISELGKFYNNDVNVCRKCCCCCKPKPLEDIDDFVEYLGFTEKKHFKAEIDEIMDTSDLHKAASTGNKKAIEKYASHIDPNRTDAQGNIPLFSYLKGGLYQTTINIRNVSAIATILKCQENLTHRNHFEQRLEHFVVSSGKFILVNYFLRHFKLDVNVQDKFGDTPLHLLYQTLADFSQREKYKDDLKKIEGLLRREGADFTIKNKEGKSVTEFAKEKNVKWESKSSLTERQKNKDSKAI